MPTFRTDVAGRYREFAPEALRAFQHAWSDRGAWEARSGVEEYGWTWLQVFSKVEAATAAEAADLAIRTYDNDARSAGLGESSAWSVHTFDVRDAPSEGPRRTYVKP